MLNTAEAPTIGVYTGHDDHTSRHVLVACDTVGAWMVLDVTADLADIRLVERFSASDDGPDQAAALAHDYLQQIDRYLSGDRDKLPVPNPAHKLTRLSFTSRRDMPLGLRSFARDHQAAPHRRRAAKPADGQVALPLAA